MLLLANKAYLLTAALICSGVRVTGAATGAGAGAAAGAATTGATATGAAAGAFWQVQFLPHVEQPARTSIERSNAKKPKDFFMGDLLFKETLFCSFFEVLLRFSGWTPSG